MLYFETTKKWNEKNRYQKWNKVLALKEKKLGFELTKKR